MSSKTNSPTTRNEFLSGRGTRKLEKSLILEEELQPTNDLMNRIKGFLPKLKEANNVLLLNTKPNESAVEIILSGDENSEEDDDEQQQEKVEMNISLFPVIDSEEEDNNQVNEHVIKKKIDTKSVEEIN